MESVERPLYYSSGDEPDDDYIYYLPVAPEIDEPEGELTHGYDTGKPNPGASKSGESGGEKSGMDSDGPPAKKTKTKDININGEAYDPNAVVSGGFLVFILIFMI